MKSINKALNDANQIVFLDFEGTQFSQEIIAIGAYKAILDNKKQVIKYDDGFKIYVYTDTKIDGLITNLTGITQNQLTNEGVSFVDAIAKFKKYVGNNLNFTSFMTYGNFDMRLLYNTASIYKIEEDEFIQTILHKNIDFSHILSTYVRSDKNEQLSLINALRLYKITPEGDIHNPQSDAKNLMLLYKAFLSNKAINKEQYLKVLMHNPHVQNPIHKALRKIVTDKVCTYDDLLGFIEEEFK